MNKQIIDDAIKALFNREKEWSFGKLKVTNDGTDTKLYYDYNWILCLYNQKKTLKQVSYKGGRFRPFDIPIERGQVLLIKYYTHDITVWVARESSVDSFVREFRVEEMSNLLRSDKV